jgi:hypothetical protein
LKQESLIYSQAVKTFREGKGIQKSAKMKLSGFEFVPVREVDARNSAPVVQ